MQLFYTTNWENPSFCRILTKKCHTRSLDDGVWFDVFDNHPGPNATPQFSRLGGRSMGCGWHGPKLLEPWWRYRCGQGGQSIITAWGSSMGPSSFEENSSECVLCSSGNEFHRTGKHLAWLVLYVGIDGKDPWSKWKPASCSHIWCSWIPLSDPTHFAWAAERCELGRPEEHAFLEGSHLWATPAWSSPTPNPEMQAPGRAILWNPRSLFFGLIQFKFLIHHLPGTYGNI